MDQWLTLEELCRYLKVSRAYLYGQAQTDQIPAVKVGRSWRFNRDKIDAWLEKKSSGGTSESEFPWSDCLDDFLKKIQTKFSKRFMSLWIYGSWARGEAQAESDVDLLIVLKDITHFAKDFNTIRSLAYESTFGRNRPVVFSTTLTDQATFLNSLEPLLLNVRNEGKRCSSSAPRGV